MESFKGKKVAVLGLGVENLPLVKFLVKNGAEVTVCDQKKEIKGVRGLRGVKGWRLGIDYLKDLTDFELVFRTPGLPRLTQELLQAELKGIEISSATRLFFDLCPAKIIGVTGTKGKGTCAALIYEILRSATSSLLKRTPPRARSASLRSPWCPLMRDEGIASLSKIYLAGNIGNPAISLIDKLKPHDWVILELSSFQLQDLQKSPHIAVVLDITSDHLDHHKTKREYTKSKENIVRFQTKKDFTVINQDYFTSFKFAVLTKGRVYYFSRKKSVDEGAFVTWSARSGEVILRINEKNRLICPTYEIGLIGLHNLENICAAIVASYLAGAKIKDIQGVVTTFKGLEHRLELVAEIDGIKYINDSFSTTPETTIAAINSLSQPLVLVCGGRSKGGNYDKMVRVILKSSVKSIILIGETAEEIEQKLKVKKEKLKITIKNFKFSKMQKIIRAAKKESKPGDIILFSPGAASFDMFKNASERGKRFKEEVKKL